MVSRDRTIEIYAKWRALYDFNEPDLIEIVMTGNSPYTEALKSISYNRFYRLCGSHFNLNVEFSY